MQVGEKQMHIALKEGQAGGYCLLPGDPGRSERIARLFENPHKVAANREFVTWAGTLEGVPVSVCSTGIGGPSAVIAMEELCAVGVHTFIRVGTCGGIDLDVVGGDLVIATGAVRQEGTSLHYMPAEFPAVSDFTVTQALVRAAREKGAAYHVGVVQSKDSFYGQHSPDRMPVAEELRYKWNAWKKGGVLASEMEGAALFVAASTLRVRAGMVLHAIWNQERRDAGLSNPEVFDTGRAVETAVEALRLLIKEERQDGHNG